MAFETLAREHLANADEPRLVCVLFSQWLENLDKKGIQVARGAKLPCEPSQLTLDRVYSIVSQHVGKDRNGGAQSAQCDAHLVQTLRIADFGCGLVRDQMAQACPANQRECSPRTHSSAQLRIACLFGGDRRLLNEFIAALGDRKSTRLNSSHLGISYAV